MEDFYVLNIWDLIFFPLLFMIIFILSNFIQLKNIQKDKRYKYFTKAALAKMFGAIALSLIYQFYYKQGGDTVNYYITAKAIGNLILESPLAYLKILFLPFDYSNNLYFNNNTGYPVYWGDGYALFVSKLISPVVFLSFNSYMASAIFFSFICLSGSWKLFLVFTDYFPKLEKQFAYAILFIPSVIFWSSGLLKDSITLSAVGWYTFSFYFYFIKKEYSLKHIANILIASFLLLSIKPYIFLATIPGSLFWLTSNWSVNIKHKLIRLLITPFLISLGVSIAFATITFMGNSLGDYKLENLVDQALIKRDDLQSNKIYSDNYFDLGKIENTPTGLLKVMPQAILATLFRPFIWEAKNPLMILSGLENFFMISFSIFLLIKLKIYNFFTLVRREPLASFSLLYSLFFAFAVGVSTPNFGALVRLRIPCIPFFLCCLIIVNHFYESEYKIKKIVKVKNRFSNIPV